MQKWEYCYYNQGKMAVHSFSKKGESVENAENLSAAQVIYVLGQKGWELVQIVDAPMVGNFYYFKRPIDDLDAESPER
jgi:hypothetical protein